MATKSIFTKLAVFLLAMGFVVWAQAQPIAPSSELKSQTKTDVAPENLPYQPVDPGAEANNSEEATSDEESADESEEDAEEVSDEEEVEEFKWEDLPFVPSKGPRLLPLPDPEY